MDSNKHDRKQRRKESQSPQTSIEFSKGKAKTNSIKHTTNANSNDLFQTGSKNNKSGKLVFFAGDSILQHVHGWDLSNDKQRVSVKSFLGIKAEDMQDYIKSLLRKKPDEIILHVGTNNIKDNSKTAEVVAADIAKNIDNGDKNFKDYITITTSSFNFQTVSESNVYRLLLSLNPRKSTGIEKIPAKIINFNMAIISATVPFEWKIARVTPIFKNGPRNLLNNYRPISILPVVSKLFEKVLYEQLHEYLVIQELLSPRQFGFRKFHSTASALLDSANEWFINMDRGSYLANRTQMCSVNGALSGTNLVICGIPQGSILGPLLFLIYINDLPNGLEYSSTRMFAHDTTLTVSGKSIQDVEVAINHDLSNVKQWLSANRLSLNLVKTEYLLIGSRYNINNLLAAPNVFVCDTPTKKGRRDVIDMGRVGAGEAT
ncbi:Hypothetical predicted protein [Paramuricea clavata]|uniref:Uncharacterized protein n=1 Tax=Paramuricea clavata TaxID=317549 RepID=A0A6S7J530_PARCT|nr:Hypothetical predicted protein [Paramuricea clavata]